MTGITDNTIIDGTKWADYKKKAMLDDYEEQEWYRRLKKEERNPEEFLEVLREA